MLNFKIDIDFSGVQRKVDKKAERTKVVLAEQILKDSNRYIPADEWTLRNSGIIASMANVSQIIWDTPYARKLYWNPLFNFSKDKNPNAQGKWFEFAKSVHLNDWLKIAQTEVDS